MPRYIDWADVVARYKAVANEHDEAGANTGYIAAAEDELDARLAPVYTTPFVPGSSNAPGAVRDLAIDLAYYKMIFMTDEGEALFKYIKDRLDAILNGQMALTTSAGVVSQGSDAWTDRNYRSSFGPDAAENWSVSEAWQRDAEDQRSGD